MRLRLGLGRRRGHNRQLSDAKERHATRGEGYRIGSLMAGQAANPSYPFVSTVCICSAEVILTQLAVFFRYPGRWCSDDTPGFSLNYGKYVPEDGVTPIGYQCMASRPLRVRAKIDSHFGASAGRAAARRRDGGAAVKSSRSGNAADDRLPPRPGGLTARSIYKFLCIRSHHLPPHKTVSKMRSYFRASPESADCSKSHDKR